MSKIKRKFYKKISPLIGNFLDSLLYKCWIIEVPLLEIDSSIQIFESLNNRGKYLTLTDKLRYKCLINCEDKETYINQLQHQVLVMVKLEIYGYFTHKSS